MNYSTLLLIILLHGTTLYAQQQQAIQRPSIGIHILLDDFASKDSLHTNGKYNNSRIGLAISYLQGIRPRTDLHITLAGSFLSFPEKNGDGSKKDLLLEGDVSIREKLFAGTPRFNPFLQTGLGASAFTGHYDLFLPAGTGMQVSLPGEAFLLLSAQYRIPISGRLYGHYYFSLGICGVIGKKKWQHLTAKAPANKSSLPVMTADSDGDGIADSNDACPLQPGSASLQGCPDTDGDGIPDNKDKCPLVKGTISLHGCPAADRDKDGVPDSLDKCPELAGFADQGGCPVISSTIIEKINLAAKNIFFETDKYILLPASYPALDTIASVLRHNVYLKLEISGHTDSTGDDQKNKSLSANRAHAVLQYLTAKSAISSDLITAAGYGSSRPVADNKTIEGRALNRRVEMRLHY